MWLLQRLSRLHPRMVAPGVLTIMFAGFVVAGRFYERLPVQPPRCSLRVLTGLPCIGCGGTRSMIALSHGRWLEALAFNPLILVCATASPLWLAWAIWRTATEQKHPVVVQSSVGSASRWRGFWITSGILAVVILDWIYLWRYLPS
ncbi:MAG: DUF2752 domain-containing protein [Verrucomicrobiales bacterium]|nr:DUF2752 domain-containing protein [Verrucomicrobiales bacterium]